MYLTKPTLSVATLNYSGVITSPYEYYQEEPVNTEDKSKKKLNQILSEAFHERLKKSKFYTGKQFSWNMGTLDNIWKTRHSPVNLPSVGVEQINCQFVEKKNQQEIEQKFRMNWEKQKTKDKNDNKAFIAYQQNYQKYTKQQINEQMQMCSKFDFLCYQTLAAEYGQNYKQRQQLSFKKAYLDQKLKIQKTFKFIEEGDTDIIFFQQSNSNLQKYLKENLKKYQFVESSSESIILVNKITWPKWNSEKVNQDKKSFLVDFCRRCGIYKQNLQDDIKKAQKNFNVNADSAFIVIDHYVFWNLHLSSKKQKNKAQLIQIHLFLQLLITMKDYHFVVGGDFNTEIEKNAFTSQLRFNSNPQNLSTVRKKRTHMQPQMNKAGKNDYSAKDYLFSNLTLIKSEIKTLNAQGKIVKVQIDNTSLLPNSNHPYDHYIVRAYTIQSSFKNDLKISNDSANPVTIVHK